MPEKPEKPRLDSEALHVLRVKDGHTLTSLAKASGYTVGYVNDLEKGRREGNAAVIKRLAVALDVPVSMLTRRAKAAA